jgi:hypothetical protein
MKVIFHDNPYSYFDAFGPPTAPQVKLIGHGSVPYRIVRSNPVSQVISADGNRTTFLTIKMRHAGRPLESSILEEVERMGVHPASLNILPAHDLHTWNVSQQFARPDTRPQLRRALINGRGLSPAEPQPRNAKGIRLP